MKPLEELINKEDPGWTLVAEWIAAAKNKVKILPKDSAKATDALYKTQVTTYFLSFFMDKRRKRH